MAIVLGAVFSGTAAELKNPRSELSLAPSPLQRSGDPDAPDYRTRVWEAEDGLPDHTVTSMVQTPDGYLWLGTFGGLVRFDGFDFDIRTPANLPGLPSVEVVNLHLEQSGRMWVSTTAGLGYLEDGRWTSCSATQGWTGDMVRTFSEAGEKVLLTSFNGQVAVARGGRITMLPPPPGQRGAGYFGHLDRQGSVWVAQDRFFGRWDGEQWVASRLMGEVTNQFRAAGTGRDGALVVVQGSMILRILNDQSVERIRVSQPLSDIWRVDEDSEGRLWISTMRHGLFRVLRSGKTTRFGTGEGLPADAIRFALEDRENGLWVGTAGGGLVSLTDRRFRYYGVEHGLGERNIRTVTEDRRGRILVGTFGAGPYFITTNRVGSLVPAGDPLSVSYVEALLVDRAGDIWVGTYGRGLHVLSNGGRRAIPAQQSGGTDVHALFEDSRGRIWIGGNQNLVVVGTNGFRTFTPQERNGVRLEKVRSLAENPVNGDVWAIRSDQVARFSGGRWLEVRGADGEPMSGMLSVRADPDGSVWLGGDGSGLHRWFQGQWSTLGATRDGWMSGIHGILDDGRGYWWLAGRGGLARLSRADLEAAVHDPNIPIRTLPMNRSDGLPAVHCGGTPNQGVCRDQAGRLWFATVKGLAVMDPEQLRLADHAPTVIVKQITYQDRHGEMRSVAWDGQSTSEVTIPAGARRAMVSWTAVGLAAPEKIRFSYRVGGNDQPWVDTGARRHLDLHIVSPTRFALEIRAVNGDGVWSRSATELAIRVQPFLWQTAPARVAASLGILGFTAFLVWRQVSARHRQRIRQLETEAELKDQRARATAIRLEAEEALRASEERFRTAMEHSPVGMAIVGLDGRWIEINAALCATFGYTAEEFMALDAIELEHPEDRRMSAELLGRVFAREIPSFELERRFIHREGRTIWAHVSVSLLWNPDGTPRHFIWHVKDVTERVLANRRREELETQLREAQKLEAVGILAGGIAHDFNNILATIVSFAELSQMENHGNPNLQENQDHILRAARRAAGLVRQILSFSRAQKPERACVSLAPIVTEALTLLRSTLPATIELETRFAPNLPPVLADSGQIHQVVLNLVTNAAHALEGAIGSIRIELDARTIVPGSPEVRVDLPSGTYVRLRVVDHGRGMSQEVLRHVFDPFFTTKAPGVGTGLGLAVVHGIVKEHGGCVAASSEVGVGSTFSVYLPVANAGEMAPAEPAHPAPLGQGERVLFVDDEAELGEASARLLDKLGYRSEAFRDAARAWRAFQLAPERFDIVVCDLTMPRMTGMDFARNVRTLRPEIPIILATGHPTVVPHSSLSDLRIEEVLAKPLELNALALALSKALDRSSPRRRAPTHPTLTAHLQNQ